MNLLQDKKFHSYKSIHNFFEKYGAELSATVPAITGIVAQFEILFSQIDQSAMDIGEQSSPTTAGKNKLKTECLAGVWKLTSAMQFHFASTGNEIAANTIKITQAQLRNMPEQAFYSFSQIVMNQYEPLVYVPYGINIVQMDALKLKLQSFPNQMEATNEARLKRKLAGQQLNTTLRTISQLLKFKLDQLMNVAMPYHDRLYDLYTMHRRFGLINATKGKPHKQGTIAPGQIVLLDKQPYRHKRAMIVSNTGASVLQAGIGLTETQMHGTPFAIPPGKTRRRISQKLAPKGEFYLIENIGDTEAEYEVWMKE